MNAIRKKVEKKLKKKMGKRVDETTIPWYNVYRKRLATYCRKGRSKEKWIYKERLICWTRQTAGEGLREKAGFSMLA